MCKLVLFEKDETLRWLYRYEMADWGYTVFDTDSPDLFLEIIMKEKPNVVVMEADPTAWESLDLLRRIRRRYEEIPISSMIPGF